MPPAKTSRVARAVDPVPASSSKGTSSGRQVNQTAAAGSSSNSSSSTNGNGNSSKSARLASAAFGPGDSDDEIIANVPGPVLKWSKKMGLYKRATNTLTHMCDSYVDEQNKGYEIDDEKWLLDAPTHYIADKATMLSVWDMLRSRPAALDASTASTTSSALPASAKIDPNELTKDAKKNIRSMIRKMWLNAANPSIGPGKTMLTKAILYRLKQNKALLGPNGAHQLDEDNTIARQHVVSWIGEAATKLRSEVKKLLRESMEEKDDGTKTTLRELCDEIAAKCKVEVDYNVMCRIAWLRKKCSDGAEDQLDIDKEQFWQDVQVDFDVVRKLNTDDYFGHLQAAFNWDLQTYGTCSKASKSMSAEAKVLQAAFGAASKNSRSAQESRAEQETSGGIADNNEDNDDDDDFDDDE